MTQKLKKTGAKSGSKFNLDLLNSTQKLAYAAFEQHDVLFLIGPAGTGKSFLSMAFAVNEVLRNNKSKIILTRPIVESGEHLGFLPGSLEEKIHPYMMPLFDAMDKMLGPSKENPQREAITTAVEMAPLAYMRGRNFTDAICIFDEAQNATYSQLKLFLTRFNPDTKLIITGDPKQCDLLKRGDDIDLMDVVNKLKGIKGIGVINFTSEDIVRHRLVADILDKLEPAND